MSIVTRDHDKNDDLIQGQPEEDRRSHPATEGQAWGAPGKVWIRQLFLPPNLVNFK